MFLPAGQWLLKRNQNVEKENESVGYENEIKRRKCLQIVGKKVKVRVIAFHISE